MVKTRLARIYEERSIGVIGVMGQMSIPSSLGAKLKMTIWGGVEKRLEGTR